MLEGAKLQEALKILDNLLEEYHIPNEKAEDGIAMINGMTVDEYFDKIGILNDNGPDSFITEDIDITEHNIFDLDYEEFSTNGDLPSAA